MFGLKFGYAKIFIMNKKKKYIFVFLAVILVLLVVGVVIYVTIGEKNDGGFTDVDVQEKGVWWWSVEGDEDAYLDFASQNGITEIYYANSGFDESVNAFIEKANGLNIDVYYLCGEWQWIDDFSAFEQVLSNYQTYQATFEHKFSGVHLDVEPHQHDDWSEFDEAGNSEILLRYLHFVDNVTSNEAYSEIMFDFDIPFWLDNYTVEFNGERKEVFKFVMDLADRTFVMSYRDQARLIYSVAENELEYAKMQNKFLFLCVETSEQSPETVSFFEEGKAVMCQELKTLQGLVAENMGEDFKNHGISIHHMESWIALKN